MHKKDGKVEAQKGYVIHTYPYKETSLILDVFTEQYGRVSIVARGARRPNSAIRSVLLPFQLLEFSWFGKSELKTLHKIEWCGGVRALAGNALISGYYLNELLIALLPKEDSIEPQFFWTYHHTVKSLADEIFEHSAIRYYELALLRSAGYGFHAVIEEHALPILPEKTYRYRYEYGIGLHDGVLTPLDFSITGELIQVLSKGDVIEKHLRKEARQFLAWLLKFALPEQHSLQSQVLIQKIYALQD
ncbi:DNA repair protein RecO [Leeia sp. TBRC 13508]|uniref:DNA repair protein RecO n=1 Tax=Leeia speluncae TaxID=2884804 RepID=A0ABS8D243_9NEIS|nr:DNA repair protein RecO [Leeia speluncae]MCB6182255.1 DNA repair protein RecO [Leeia speluncae]